jgi:hypothetical protein
MPKMMHVRGASAPRRAFIAIPAYSGAVGAECVASLMASIEPLRLAGIGVDLCLETGNCHVDDARNGLVRQFLEGDCDDFVFLDEDVGFHSSSLVKLLTVDADLVAGVYPKKQDDEEFPVFPLEGERWANRDGLVEVEGAPTGFMRIRRSVLERLRDAHESRAFVGSGGGLYHPIFERVIEDGRRWSGDYAFCRKWRKLGGKVMVDPEMRFTHTGLKSWEGTLGDFWRKEAGLPSLKLGDALRRLKAGEATHEVFTQLHEGWGNPCAALPDALMAAYRMAKRAKGPVLEVGSGITTMVMVAAGAEVHSLEADLVWREKLLRTLDEQGMKASVHYAPMHDYGGFVWYSVPDGLPERFAMALCDGPERTYGRAGLFRLLGDRIADADWLMDDCNDSAQLAILDHYAKGREVHLLGTEGMKQFALAFKPALREAA